MVALIDAQYDALPIDQVIHADCLDALKTLPDNSVDAICCDPPAGISFMGKDWDNYSNRDISQNKSPSMQDIADRNARHEGNSPSYFAGRGQTVKEGMKARHTFIAFMTEVMTEALRVLKPGGHAFVWSLPRTSHWTATALEDAGFEIRDEVSHVFASESRVQSFMASLSEEQRNAFMQIVDGMGENMQYLHCFGSGFPKSTSIDKQIDRIMGEEREVIGKSNSGPSSLSVAYEEGKCHNSGIRQKEYDITAPATPEAQAWQGWHSALKPSHENWLLVRKPLAEKTIAAQVLATGTGALNIDISRIETHGESWRGNEENAHEEYSAAVYGTFGKQYAKPSNPQGRFPSNTLFSHSPECQERGVKRVRGTAPPGRPSRCLSTQSMFVSHNPDYHDYNDEQGMETVADYDCAPNCPVRLLGEQSGVSNGHRNKVSDNRSQINGSVALHGTRSLGMRTPENSYNDQGTAARYFQCFPPALSDAPPYIYTSKASRSERNRGCEALPEREGVKQFNEGMEGKIRSDGTVIKEAVQQSNSHPTVKSLSLMSYLIRMITPPNGIVLDMFGGSGSTGVAAIECGMHYILIEQELEYVEICRARLAHAGSPSRGKSAQGVSRVYGGGKGVGTNVARCPEHDMPKPGKAERDTYGTTSYICGCKIVYGKANATPAPVAAPREPLTLWEEEVSL